MKKGESPTGYARCKLASAQAEKMVNLKAAPYLQNLNMLTSYTHWDSVQIEQHEQDFSQALFDRRLNNAIGFTHDLITGACVLSDMEVPTRCILLRNQFVWMST